MGQDAVRGGGIGAADHGDRRDADSGQGILGLLTLDQDDGVTVGERGELFGAVQYLRGRALAPRFPLPRHLFVVDLVASGVALAVLRALESRSPRDQRPVEVADLVDGDE